MKHQVTLTITSLLSILLMAFHFTDDIVRGFEPGRIATLDMKRRGVRQRNSGVQDRSLPGDVDGVDIGRIGRDAPIRGLRRDVVLDLPV